MTPFERYKKEIAEFGLEYQGLYYGTYRGFVADRDDPDNRGRIKLLIPQIYGDDIHDYWACSRGMFASKDAGMVIIPKKDDAVWVTFENGDPRFPIWEHGWFGTGEMPAAGKNNGTDPTNMVWQSYDGRKIELDEKNKLVRVYSKDGTYSEYNDTGISHVAKKISLGTLNGSAEPAVLGDTAATLLKELIDDIGTLSAITVPTGVSGPISSSPQWATLVGKWATKFNDFKSQVVSLDKN